MSGHAYVKCVYEKTRRSNIRGRDKIVPCKTPDRWIKRARKELTARGVEYREYPYKDGVIFTWL